MSYDYKVAVTKKYQTKYIEANLLNTYKQLGWRECTGLIFDTTGKQTCDTCNEIPEACECDTEYPTSIKHTETIDTTTESAEEITASAVLKPVKRRK